MTIGIHQSVDQTSQVSQRRPVPSRAQARSPVTMVSPGAYPQPV